MKKLDRNRYYAQVVGMAEDGAAFYQDGLYFDGAGNCLDSGREAEPPATDEEAASGAAENKGESAADKLKDMTVAELRKIAKQVADATDEQPERWSGKGLKKVLVSFILKHTE